MLEGALQSVDKYKWALLLLPGILTVGCFGLVTNVLKLTELQIFLLGSLISIPLLLLVAGGLYLALALLAVTIKAANNFTVMTFPAMQVRERTFWIAVYCLSLLLSPILGANLAALLERDVLHRAASFVTMLGTLDADSIWSPLERLTYANTRGLLARSEQLDGRPAIPGRLSPSRTGDAYFEVHLKGGSVFVGWPRAYGPRGAQSEIYLSPACEVREKEPRLSLVEGPGVVIKESEIVFITLLDREERTSGEEHDCKKLAR